MQHRAQERISRAPAPAAALVHLEIGAAEVVAVVEYPDLGDATLGRGFAPGVDDLPAHARVLDAHLAAGAIPIGRTALIIFKGFENRQNIVPRPAAVARAAQWSQSSLWP